MIRIRLRTLLFALLVVLAVIAVEAWGSTQPAQAAPASCRYSGGGPPFSLQSFEADESRRIYLETLRLAAANQLFPEDEEFQLPTLLVGEHKTEDSTATIPPEILYAIAWIESKLAQAAYEVNWGTLGAPVISPDCGYGIMQITSTIVNDGGLPSRYEALVGTHFAYNIAAGARILAEKWNDGFFPSVGEADPAYVESWYYALWAYNGWAGLNHPDNPAYALGRPPYDCNADTSDWNDYPYQEKVLGCIINPPEIGGQRLWDPLPVVLPNLSSLTTPGAPLDLDLFYAGLDNMYVQVAGPQSPFAEMNMSLPTGALPRHQPGNSQADAARARVLGEPSGRLDTNDLDISSSQLQSGNVPLAIFNDGTSLMAWRIVEAPSWLSFDIQAGVALGRFAYGNGPDHSRLRISAAAGGVPEGSHRGRIVLEFHYPDGRTDTESIAISLDKRGAAYYEAGRPQS